MVRYILIAFLLVFAGVALSATVAEGEGEEDPGNIPVEMLIVDDIEKFKASNPEVETVELEKNDKTRGSCTYYLGRHVTGDRLIARRSNNYSWSTPHNVRLTLQYPRPGEKGAIFTCAIIAVNSSACYGRAFVTSGGVGQRFVTILIEAYGVKNFSYSAKFYGK